MGGTIRSCKLANEENNQPSPPTTSLNNALHYFVCMYITLNYIQIQIQTCMQIQIQKQSPVTNNQPSLPQDTT